MLERFIGPKRCSVHNRLLERDSAPVRYGLVKFRDEYRQAANKHFPNAKLFVLGGCRLGPPEEREVLFCADCRAAESKWHEYNPDLDDAVRVQQDVTTARRDLPDSVAKKLLKQSQLEKPERVDRYLWIVYRISLYERIAYNSEQQTYHYPYAGSNSAYFGSVSDLASALNKKFET